MSAGCELVPKDERTGTRLGSRSAREHVPVEVLLCGNVRSNGWRFPPAVDHHLRVLTKGKRVCHLFGGMSQFGTRIDIDRTVNPHVLADAWLPPFLKDAFDVVILDPPYIPMDQATRQQLLRGAAYIARESVIWFHTLWIDHGPSCRLTHAWLVRVGDSCAVRCLQVFTTSAVKPIPRLHFTRGPAVRYNRWLAGGVSLPFENEDPE